MYNGERTAGITIQSVNPRDRTGEVVRTGEVEIGRKSYSRVWREVEDLGCRLYLEAVLAIRKGEATFVPAGSARRADPCIASRKVGDILRFWRRRWRVVSGLRVIVLTETFPPGDRRRRTAGPRCSGGG